MEERLQKIISRAGVASRRHAEQLISTGQVTVNGKLVTELGSKADAARDHIKVSGKLLQGAKEKVYLVLNKPPNVVCTLQDPEGRASLAELLRFAPARVFPVGRLPYAASGLLLLTNDGELTDQLFRAHKMTQTWWLKVRGELTREQTAAMGRKTNSTPHRVRPGDNAWYEFAVRDVKGDSLHTLLALGGHPVEKVRRVRFGEIDLGTLRPGEYRPLTDAEMVKLRRMASPDYIAPAAEDARATARRAVASGWRSKPAKKRFPRDFRSGSRARHDHGRLSSFPKSDRSSRRESAGSREDGPSRGSAEKRRSKPTKGTPMGHSRHDGGRPPRQDRSASFRKDRAASPGGKDRAVEPWYSQSKFARTGRSGNSGEERPRREGRKRTDQNGGSRSSRESGNRPNRKGGNAENRWREDSRSRRNNGSASGRGNSPRRQGHGGSRDRRPGGQQDHGKGPQRR